MKLIDALQNVDRSPTNTHHVDEHELKSALGIYGNTVPEDYETRVKTHFVVNWLCTDTWVGLAAIYFDDELMGYSWQPARKSDAEYKFVSMEAATRLRDYLQQECTEITLVDLDEEISETYTIEYGSQLLTYEGFYNGEPVTVIEESIVCGYALPVDEWSMVRVKTADGTEHKIHVWDFQIPLNLRKEG